MLDIREKRYFTYVDYELLKLISRVNYQNRIKILLGNIAQVDYKIKFAKRIIDKNIDKNEKGTVDLTSLQSNSKVYFYPYKEHIKKAEENDKEISK